MKALETYIRTVRDFPKKGIGFKDITTLIKDGDAFRKSVDALCEPFRNQQIDLVTGIEARGFIFGAAVALELGVGFVPVRKPGNLPAETIRETYSLEYGTDAVEIHRDAVQSGMRVLIVDDLLATGGTAAAAIRLVQQLGGDIAGAAFLIELSFLGGRKKLGSVPIHVVIGVSEE